jgi:hypothetical protein
MEYEVAGNLEYCIGKEEETGAQAVHRPAELQIHVHAQGGKAYIGAIDKAHEV